MPCVHVSCALWPPPQFNWRLCLLSSTCFKLFYHSFMTMCHSLSWACVHTYSCLFIFLFSCIVICYQCMVYIYLCTCFHILNCNIQYKLHLLWIIPILHYLHNCLCCLTCFLRQFTYYLHLLVCLEIIKFDEFISSPLLILIMTYSWIFTFSIQVLCF